MNANDLLATIQEAVSSQDASKYTEAIRTLLNQEGLEVANQMNHIALERRIISLPMFQQASRVLAQVILNR